MGRTKKEYISLNIKADASVMKRFTAYCEAVGQTKTLAFERIVSAYLDQYERTELESDNTFLKQKRVCDVEASNG